VITSAPISAVTVPSSSKAASCPPDPGYQCQDAKRGDHAAIGQPEHQQEPHGSGNRNIFVFDRQLRPLKAA
jgi:hypothetical protein